MPEVAVARDLHNHFRRGEKRSRAHGHCGLAPYFGGRDLAQHFCARKNCLTLKHSRGNIGAIHLNNRFDCIHIAHGHSF